MTLRDMSVRRKLTVIMVIVSLAAMVLMRLTFLTVDYMKLRQSTVRQVRTLAEVTATNSTAALAFQNPDDARDILSALSAERNVTGACLYDRAGGVFATYPDKLPPASFPASVGPDGFRLVGAAISGFQPVVQGANSRLGTLYIRFDTSPVLSAWLRQTLLLSPVMMVLVLLITLGLSGWLQRQISEPILAIAETARAVSERRDYSVRAKPLGKDELGQLTEAFNRMLEQIESQNRSIKESETQLRTIVENLNEGLVVSDLEGQLLHFNRVALGMHGFTTPEECRLHMSQFAKLVELSTLEGEVLTIAQWPLSRILRGEELGNCEVRFRHLEPAWTRIYKYGGALVKDAAGQAMLAIITIEDITERKIAEMQTRELNVELEARVRQRTGELEAANKELEAFSYSVSHDLRAPLRHIDGFAGLLSKRSAAVLDEEGRRYLGTISGAAKQMGRLIDDLLAFSRAGRSELRRVRVPHDDLVAAIIREGGYDRREKAIEWSVSPLPDVDADAAMLRQVWSNLIENAVKYSSKSGKPRVEIGATTGAGDPVFHVRDNGVGFDMKYVEKLFGVFQRLHSSADFEGTGIGLANVRRIVARHGGRTWAEGAVGKGAAFFFTLPAAGGPPGAARAGNQPGPFAGQTQRAEASNP